MWEGKMCGVHHRGYCCENKVGLVLQEVWRDGVWLAVQRAGFERKVGGTGDEEIVGRSRKTGKRECSKDYI